MFIIAHALGTTSRSKSAELLRMMHGQHQKFGREFVREQLQTREMQHAFNEIQSKVLLLEALDEQLKNKYQHSGSK